MRIRDKKILKILLMFTVFIGVLKVSSRYFIVNTTHSLPRGIYRLYSPENTGKGDVVVFDIPDNAEEYVHGRSYVPSIVTTMMKIVASDSIGDEIKIENQELTVNNENWGIIKKYDSQGRKVPELAIEDLKKENHLLLLSKVENSFDGRYFGVIPREKIRNKARLVIGF